MFILLFNCLIKKNAPCKNFKNFTVSVLRYSYVVPQLHKWKSGNFWKPWFLGLGLPEFEILWVCFVLGLYQSKKSSIVKIGDFDGSAHVCLTRSSTVNKPCGLGLCSAGSLCSAFKSFRLSPQILHWGAFTRGRNNYSVRIMA